MQNAHHVYSKALDDDGDDDIKLSLDWYDVHDKDVFWFKQGVIEFLKEAKKLRGDDFDSDSVNFKASQHAKCSRSSSSSTKSKLIEAKAEAVALEVKTAFLKEKQALRMAAEELELQQQIAEAEAEEK